MTRDDPYDELLRRARRRRETGPVDAAEFAWLAPRADEQRAVVVDRQAEARSVAEQVAGAFGPVRAAVASLTLQAFQERRLAGIPAPEGRQGRIPTSLYGIPLVLDPSVPAGKLYVKAGTTIVRVIDLVA